MVGHIKGDFNPAQSLRSGLYLVSPNLINQLDLLPATERYSFVFEGNGLVLDHALTSQSAQAWVRGIQFGRGNADAAHGLLGDPLTAAVTLVLVPTVVLLVNDIREYLGNLTGSVKNAGVSIYPPPAKLTSTRTPRFSRA